MNYKYYKSLNLRDQVKYLLGLIKYWKSLGVTNDTDILRELKVNTNNDPQVVKIVNLILNNK